MVSSLSLAPAGPGAPASHPARAHPWRFHDLLSELNPLQYIPVVGTIYRAVTGDTIPENARLAGSLVVSGLTGGPVGIATNLVITAVEKLAGVDPEHLGQSVLAGLFHAGQSAGAPAAVARAVPGATESRPALAFSVAQLASYGVTSGPDGTLRRGMLAGSDVLNGIELARLGTPLIA